MRKIYFIDESVDRIGGVERVINTLSNDLIKGDNINIISLYKSRDKPYFKYNKKIKIEFLLDRSGNISTKFKKVRLLYLMFRFYEKLKEKILINYKIKRSVKAIAPDATIIFGRVNTAMLFLPYINKAHKIIVREAVHLYYYSEEKQEKIKRLFSEKVNTFIMSSDECINVYKNLLGDSIDLVKIYNPLGIIPKKVKSLDTNSIVTVGRFDSHKGYDYLIMGWGKIVKEFPDAKLRIVGDGYYKSEMAKLIKELKLTDSITLVPPTNDIVSELICSSIFVMPSRFEGYANALVEAMACGLACITYNWLTGSDEIIIDGYNGVIVNLENRYEYMKKKYVNKNDINNLSNAIIELLKDKNKRKKYSENSIKIIKSRQKDAIIKIWKDTILK